MNGSEETTGSVDPNRDDFLATTFAGYESISMQTAEPLLRSYSLTTGYPTLNSKVLAALHLELLLSPNATELLPFQGLP